MLSKISFNRLYFCNKCFFKNRPLLNSFCVVYFEKENKYRHISMDDMLSSRVEIGLGFTPHIMTLYEDNYHNLEYQIYCGICEVKMKFDLHGNSWPKFIDKPKISILYKVWENIYYDRIIIS